MGAFIADDEPGAAGSAASVDVEALTGVTLDECAALAVQREGGEDARWNTSLERNLVADDRVTFVALDAHHSAGTIDLLRGARPEPGLSTPGSSGLAFRRECGGVATGSSGTGEVSRRLQLSGRWARGCSE